MEVVLILALLTPAVIGVVALVRQATRQRTEQLRATAQRLGWNFREDVPYDTIPNIERFELFGSGRNRKLKNVLTSPADEVRAVVFDYSYVTGGGKSQQTHQQTVFYATSDRLALPVFSLRPENFFHRFAAMLGYQDIDLEGRPEFSRMFLLRGEDEAAVRAALSDDVAEFFEHHGGMCAAGAGRELLYWRPGGFKKADDVPLLIQEGFDIAARFTH